MLRELRVSEQRYRAVLEVLGGATATEVARLSGVSRQTVHEWLRRWRQRGPALTHRHSPPVKRVPELFRHAGTEP